MKLIFWDLGGHQELRSLWDKVKTSFLCLFFFNLTSSYPVVDTSVILYQTEQYLLLNIMLAFNQAILTTQVWRSVQLFIYLGLRKCLFLLKAT